MAENYINRELYDAIVHFDESDEAKDYYYDTMDRKTGKVTPDGWEETTRDVILRVYGLLFCEDTGLESGQPAGPDDIVATADRLYIGSVGYDSEHWYRMKYHFPVIDDDNYDRFAALVISDLRSGPLHEAAVHEGKMLIVGEADPLHMTAEERRNQKIKTAMLPGGEG